MDLMGAGGSQGGGGARGTKRPIVDPFMGSASRPSKRQKGPIPPEFSLQRLVSSSRSSSPAPPASPLGILEERPDSPLPSLGAPLPQPQYPFNAPPIPHLQETTTVPHLRPEQPIIPVPGLSPSPAAITPGYLHQVSPPGSPAPYPREDIPPYPGATPPHPILNGGKKPTLLHCINIT